MMRLMTKKATPVSGKSIKVAAAKTKAKAVKILLPIAVFVFTTFNTAMSVFAAAAPGGGYSGGGTGATANPDTAFTDLIKFFATWFGRLGLVVGFIGAIMFALAIRNKNNSYAQTLLSCKCVGFPRISDFCVAGFCEFLQFVAEFVDDFNPFVVENVNPLYQRGDDFTSQSFDIPILFELRKPLTLNALLLVNIFNFRLYGNN